MTVDWFNCHLFIFCSNTSNKYYVRMKISYGDWSISIMLFDPDNYLGNNKKLIIFTIVCCFILYGGLGISFIFWKNYVNNQFALFIIVTDAIFLVLETSFKIPAFFCYRMIKKVSLLYERFNDNKNQLFTDILSYIVLSSLIICTLIDIHLIRITYVIG